MTGGFIGQFATVARDFLSRVTTVKHLLKITIHINNQPTSEICKRQMCQYDRRPQTNPT